MVYPKNEDVKTHKTNERRRKLMFKRMTDERTRLIKEKERKEELK